MSDRHEIDLPEDPTGIDEPHDVLAAEEFPMPAGAVTVNDAQVNYFAFELPMGGWKESGLGTRHGADGIRKYTKKQALLVTRFAPLKRDLHMRPYGVGRTRLVKRLLRLVYGRGR